MGRDLRDRGEREFRGGENQKWVILDMKFHEILIEASGNTWLKKIIQDVRIMWNIATVKLAEMKFDRTVMNCRVHGGIVRGLRKRDLGLASYWMKRHGANSFRILKIVFENS